MFERHPLASFRRVGFRDACARATRINTIPGAALPRRKMRGHQQRRARGHDDLAMPRPVHHLQQFQELDLARRRQRRLRLVEDEDALALAALFEEAEKTLAVGMREEVRRRPFGFIPPSVTDRARAVSDTAPAG